MVVAARLPTLARAGALARKIALHCGYVVHAHGKRHYAVYVAHANGSGD